ncbi:MAG TPA: archaetidylserine decarboxylase [Gemmataceae bacterium]|nr:archaetidylserine decarboxylase [Gemmataceae bacterium]
MSKKSFAIRLEQFRQAKRIHGGLLKLGIALLGVKLSRVPIPTQRLRHWLYRIYGNKFPPGLDESESERPFRSYPSLNALFTRGIKPEMRPIAAEPAQFVCPCDGTVQDVGTVADGKILTVKGIEYTLQSLLPGADATAFEGGRYAVIFLSPLQCHRVFSPHEGELQEAIHVPGYRLLVHPPFQTAEYPVYTLNERMILRLATPLGPCALVMVAGWGVGNVTLPHAPQFRPKPRRAGCHAFSPAPAIKRGDWIGTFELGSTVVLLTPPAPHAASLITPNMEVRYGQPLFAY